MDAALAFETFAARLLQPVALQRPIASRSWLVDAFATADAAACMTVPAPADEMPQSSWQLQVLAVYSQQWASCKIQITLSVMYCSTLIMARHGPAAALP